MTDPTQRTDLQSRILITRAMTTLALEGQESAFAILAAARDLGGHPTPPLLDARLHLQAGAIYVACSKWADALTSLEQVDAVLGQLTPRERCAALINQGMAAMSLGTLDPARAALTQALDLAVAERFPAQEFKARHNLGCVEALAGNIPAALRLMGEASQMPEVVARARALLDYGAVLLDAGLLDDAVVTLHQALEAARRDRLSLERGDIYLDLARSALLREDLAAARTYTGRAARAFISRQAWSRATEAELMGAVVDVAGGRRLTRALEIARQWSDAPLTLPTTRLAARIRIDISLSRGQIDEAALWLDKLSGGPIQPLGVVLHERLLAARLALLQEERTRARRILRDSAQLLARDQGSVHSLEVRAGLAFHAGRIRDVDLAAASATGRVDELFDSVERWRATSQRAVPLRAPTDQQTADLVADLRRLRLRALPANSGDEVDRLQAAITQRLRSRPGDHPLARGTQPVSLRVTRRLAAAQNATIVSFHIDRGLLVRLVVSPHALQHRVLGPVEELRPRVHKALWDARAAALAPASMLPTVSHARECSLRDIDTVLLSGCSFDPQDLVVVVPTALVAPLPWRALPTLREAPVILSPSVTAWARRSPHALQPLRVAALAGPGLPRALEEVVGVAEAWGAHTALCVQGQSKYAATRDVVDGLASASVVHIAAHGRHVRQSPLFSSLELADGPLFAHEIATQPGAEHVVLSACDVGQSHARPGDEPLGLAAALLSLGVSSVIAATTPVRDSEAAAAMVDYHQRLSTGLDAASALRDTTREIPGAASFCVYGATWAPPPLTPDRP